MYMKINKNNLCDNIVHVLMIILISSIIVFETYTWGKYILLFCLMGILGAEIVRNNGKYYIFGFKYIFSILAFTGYVLISAIWARNFGDAITKGKTLFEILLMFFILFNYHCRIPNGVRNILIDIKLSSFFVVIYSILYYGIDNLITMAQLEERMQNTYTNVNTIGMFAAVGTLIQLDEMVKNKKVSLGGVVSVLSVILIALTQSRKALVMVVVGAGLIFCQNVYSKSIVKTVFKFIIYGTLGILFMYYVSKLSVFSGILERMEELWNGFTGNGAADNSSYVRNRMLQIGWEQFKQTPLLGIGMGNTHYIVLEKLGRDTYLHNNFIELLAGGGVVGFVIYYSMYLYTFVNLWRYRAYKNKEYGICITLMLVLLMMDYGRVSYYSKNQYIYLMLYFLEIEHLKRNFCENRRKDK